MSGNEKDISAEIGDMCDTRLAELIVALVKRAVPSRRRGSGPPVSARRRGRRQDSGRARQGAERTRPPLSTSGFHELFDRIATRDDKSSSGSPWFSGKATSTSARPATTSSICSASTRRRRKYQTLLLTAINRLYIDVRDHLSDQLREIGSALPDHASKNSAGLIREQRTLVSERSAKFEAVPVADRRARRWTNWSRRSKKLNEEEIVASTRTIEYRKSASSTGPFSTNLPGPGRCGAGARSSDAGRGQELSRRSLPPLRTNRRPARRDRRVPGRRRQRDVRRGRARGNSLKQIRKVSVASIPGDDSGMMLATSFAKAMPGATLLSSDRSDEILIYRIHALSGFGDASSRWDSSPMLRRIASETVRRPVVLAQPRDDIHDWNSRPLRGRDVADSDHSIFIFVDDPACRHRVDVSASNAKRQAVADRLKLMEPISFATQRIEKIDVSWRIRVNFP